MLGAAKETSPCTFGGATLPVFFLHHGELWDTKYVHLSVVCKKNVATRIQGVTFLALKMIQNLKAEKIPQYSLPVVTQKLNFSVRSKITHENRNLKKSH